MRIGVDVGVRGGGDTGSVPNQDELQMRRKVGLRIDIDIGERGGG